MSEAAASRTLFLYTSQEHPLRKEEERRYKPILVTVLIHLTAPLTGASTVVGVADSIDVSIQYSEIFTLKIE